VVSNFPGGKKVQSGHVVVMDMQGHELLSGTTNEEGEFSFKIPRREDIKIVLMAGEGHQAEWTLHASEMDEWNKATTAPEIMPSIEQGKTTMTASHPSWEDKVGPQYPRYDVKDIENAIEPLLDRKLGPIKKMLIESQQKGPGVRDIVAGVGYILGLVGIAAYVHSRKRRG
jgi:nickel transport protein